MKGAQIKAIILMKKEVEKLHSTYTDSFGIDSVVHATALDRPAVVVA